MLCNVYASVKKRVGRCGDAMSEIGLPLDKQMALKRHTQEPLANNPSRDQWVLDQAARTAQQHLASAVNHMASGTVRNMTDKKFISAADADGGGTIDRSEFDQLMVAAGGEEHARHAMALFNMMDKDGDGELTEDEMKQLAAMKREFQEDKVQA